MKFFTLMKAYQLEYWLSLEYSTQKTLKKLLSVAWSVLNSLSSFDIRESFSLRHMGGCTGTLFLEVVREVS